MSYEVKVTAPLKSADKDIIDATKVFTKYDDLSDATCITLNGNTRIATVVYSYTTVDISFDKILGVYDLDTLAKEGKVRLSDGTVVSVGTLVLMKNNLPNATWKKCKISHKEYIPNKYYGDALSMFGGQHVMDIAIPFDGNETKEGC